MRWWPIPCPSWTRPRNARPDKNAQTTRCVYRARLDMSTVLVPEMQRALEAIFRCADENLPLNQTSLQQMLDEAAFRQLAHGQAYNHDIRLQRQDIDMYLDRLQTAKPISEQVKGMSDGQLESYFANLGKKKGARPAETDE